MFVALALLGCAPPVTPLELAADAKTDGPVDATSRDWATGVRQLSTSTGGYAGYGYQVDTFELTAGYALDIPTPEGERPRFLVAWPTTDDLATPHPVTLFLHGGSTDIDSADDPDGEADRCTRAWSNTQANRVINASPYALLLAEQGHIIVAPLNAYCDGWAGLGADDPADTLHAGERLAESALGYVLWGQSRFAIDTDLVTLAGSSLGGIGLSWTLARVPEIDQIVMDSAVGDFVRYSTEAGYSEYDLATRTARGEHVIGGPAFDDEAMTIPSSWYDRYVEHSLELLIEDGTFTQPIFQLYNDQDPLCPGAANRDTVAVVEAAYDPSGIRHTDHDVDHDDPAHGQLTDRKPLYGSWGASRFAMGHHVAYFEAEDDDPRRLGAVFSGGPDDGYLSKAGGREAYDTDGSGSLFRFTVPSVPRGTQVTVAWFLEMEDPLSPVIPGAVLSLRDGAMVVAQKRLTISDAAFDVDDYDGHRAAVQAATLTATRGAGGSMVAEVFVTGTAHVRVDVAVVSWEE